MSLPAGKCVFCGEAGNLTKSHIWPEWAEAILPQTATHHEQIIGKFDTFDPKMAHPVQRRRIKPGHVGTRKPRNTCVDCNGGWMRHIEEAAMADIPPLLRGEPHLLNVSSQRAIAAFLCLVSMRIECTSEARTIPSSDHNWLQVHSEPPTHWKIWLARYKGSARMDHRYTGMHTSSSPNVPTSIKYCNTQVTTLVVGHLCAHLFSSIDWPDFGGYDGIELRQIWPVNHLDIQVALLPIVREDLVPWLHEAIGRESRQIPNS